MYLRCMQYTMRKQDGFLCGCHVGGLAEGEGPQTTFQPAG